MGPGYCSKDIWQSNIGGNESKTLQEGKEK
jgi:hypothetical protein